MRIAIFILITVLFVFSSCKKDKNFTKDHLDFSTDSVLFDTVFTTIGSTTKKFKIYNNNNAKILIEEIQLMGGESSPFRINIDGVPGTYHENIELGRNDSLFAFVEVTLQVNNATNPLVISDSIRFLTNGKNQYVHLDVWGQDAYFHANEIVSGTWLNDKPHVLYGVAAVGYPGIDSNLNLTIPQGTQIYCHKNSTLIVYKSSIDIQGQLNNEVTFQGDRLESFYDDVTGQWWGIRLIEAQSSTINYTNIINGSVGLQVDSTQSALTLSLANSKISNCQFFNFNVNAGSHVVVENCLFGDAGLYSVFLFAGGEYQFKHCNIVNYWSGSRGGPGLAIKNWYEYEGTKIVRDVVNSRFDNCAIYGTIDKELEVDTIAGATFNCLFNNNLIKRDEIYLYANFASNYWNLNPLFIDAINGDFHFEAGSALSNVGDALNSNSFDIEGTIRSLSNPDIGCYEEL